MGNILTKIRKKYGLTQEEFATEIGVNRATVNRMETGKGQPGPATTKKIRAFIESKITVDAVEKTADLVIQELLK